VKGLKTYFYTRDGELKAVDDLSFHVNRSESIGLVGESACGKSVSALSVMRLIPYPPGVIIGGEIMFDGVPLRDFDIHSYRQRIGYVPQDRRIFPTLTVQDNLEVIERKVEGGWTVDKVFSIFPILEPLKSRKGMHLSGGEQQILAVARPLMTNPKLLLLDEPSEGLAPLIVKAIEELVKRIIATGISAVVAEQNMRFAMKITQRGYIIDKGRIHHQGAMEELKEDQEIIGKYLAV